MTTRGLIIPSINSDDQFINTDISNSPPSLPQRDPGFDKLDQEDSIKTPIMEPNTSNLQLDIHDFKLDRSEGVLFSPASIKTSFNVDNGVINDISEPPQLPQRAPQLPQRKNDYDNNQHQQQHHYHDPFPIGMDPITKTLIMERQYQVDYTIDEFKRCGLTTKLKLNNSVGNGDGDLNDIVQYAIRIFDYESIDKHQLYKLLMNTKIIDSSIFDMVNPSTNDSKLYEQIDKLVNEMKSVFESTKLAGDNDLQFKFKNDLVKLYTLLGTTSLGEIEPSPLIIMTLLFCGDILVTLVLAFMIHCFVFGNGGISNEQFQFALLRSIEEVDYKYTLKMISQEEEENFQINLNNNDLWMERVLHWDTQGILPKVFNNLIIYGPLSLIGDCIDKFTNLEIDIGIPRFDRYLQEFNSLNGDELKEQGNYKLTELKDTHFQLEGYLENLKNRYTDLLTNFQQLNGESMRVKALEKMKINDNSELVAENSELQSQIENLIGNYEVLRVRVEKNREMEKVNDGMKVEISRLLHLKAGR